MYTSRLRLGPRASSRSSLPDLRIAEISGRDLPLLVDPSQRVCHADPVVSAAVAELNILMTSTMGILSCLTTAWWGSVCVFNNCGQLAAEWRVVSFPTDTVVLRF